MMWLVDWFEKQKQARATVVNASETRVQVLAISIWLNDRLVLEQLGKREGWSLRFTNSPPDAFRLAMEKHFDVVLCDRNQPGYPWREVVDRLAENSPRSRILLVAPDTDNYLWRDVIQQGGYGVLSRPLRDSEALHTISVAAGFLAAAGGSDGD